MFHINVRPPRPFFDAPSLSFLLVRHPVKFLLLSLYNLLSRLRKRNRHKTPPVRIVCIADTHTFLPSALPDGDVLIHAGDLSNAGDVAELQEQIDWIAFLPYQHKIVIAGNHDTYLDPRTRPSLPEVARDRSLDWKGIHYLQHSLVSLKFPADGKTRTLTFFGAPQIPACGPYSTFAFQYERGTDMWMDTIPRDIDVLITHTPPKYHLDLPLPSGLGCEHLLSEVWRVQPRLHVFGHVHWGAGTEVCWWDDMQKAYETGMACSDDSSGRVVNMVLWSYVGKVVVFGITELFRNWVLGVPSGGTDMINAAQMLGHTGMLGNTVRVVDI